MNDGPIEALLEKLSSGDNVAAEEVFLAYEPYLRKIVRRRLPLKLRAKFDSTDIVQSVWVDLLRDFRDGGLHFTDANHLRAFLIRVTRNRFNDRFRRNRLATERERPFAQPQGEAFAISRQPTPSEIVQAEDLWEQLLALCPPAHKDLLRLRREGVPLAEIATRTGLHPGSVRRILRDLARKVAFKQRLLVSNTNAQR
jgi:RNA polymerase sigma-70 factor (ECF subfamily)